MRRNLRLLSLLCVFAALAFRAASIELDFVVTQSTASMQVSLSPGTSDSKSYSYSGHARASVEFDDETLRPTSFTFLDGQISQSNTSLSVSGNVNVVGQGIFFTVLSLRTNGLAITPHTVNAPGGFLSGSSQMRAVDHVYITNQGSLSISVDVDGELNSEVVDFSQDPDFDNSIGANLTIEQLSATQFSRTLQFTLSVDFGDYDSTILDGTNSRLTLSQVASVVATATAVVPTPFARWASESGLDAQTLGERNAFGLEYPLLFALGQPATAPRLPLTLVAPQEGGTARLEVDLPSSGMNARIWPQYSESLRADDWAPLPVEYVSAGEGAFDVGNSGRVEITFPEADSGYIRLVTTP